MKVTIICHFAAFLFICSHWQNGGQMTNNFDFHVLVLNFTIWNLQQDMAKNKLASPIKLWKQLRS